MGKFLLKFAALCIVAVCSVMPIKADTSILTAEDGWTKITSIPENLEDYYYVFVDNTNDLMLLMDVGANQGSSYRTMYYKASVNPIENKAALWGLESMASVSGYESCLTIRNAEYTTYAMQTELNAAWHFRTHDQPNPCEWTAVIFAYSADGYWTLQNGKYPDSGYVGPWNGSETESAVGEGAEVAANKLGAAIGQFQIYAISRVLVDLPAEIAKINTLIALCESYSANSTPNAESYKSTFDAAIAEAKSVRDVATTAEELNAAYSTLETARQTYVVNAVPAEGYPFDLTFKVVNPYFDNGTTGWVSNTGAQNNKIANNQSGDITGSFYENWNGSSYTGTIEQTITNLPNGVYSVTIAAFRDQLIDGASEQDAVYVFGNDQSTLVTATTGTYYTVENVKVFDGTLRLGIESTVANYKWMGIDNVSIAMTGAISDEEVETLLAAKETLAAAEVLGRVIAKKIGINNILNDAQCAANIEEAAILYNDAISDPTSVAAEDINAMIATLWADLDDYTANVLNGEFESVTDGVLDGWTTTTDGEWAKFGVSAYGTNTSVNGVIAPATDILGQAENNTFGYSAGWGLTVKIEQEIFLPAGKHILTYDVYNANATTTNTPTNLTCVTVGETSFVSTLASYEAGAWMSDVIEVEMAEAGSVTLTIGYTAAAGKGSDGSPKLWIDNVKVYSTNVHRRANAKAGKYGTICLPFNAELPENMLLYSVAGVDSKDAPTTLYLNKETSLQAGVAYIYYSLDANDIMLQKSDVAELLDAPESSSNGLTGTFVGAIPTTETTFTGEHYYLLSQNKWVKVKNEYAGQVGVKRFRAYLDVQQIADENTGTEAVSYARSMNIGGGGANGIEEILNSLNGGDDLFYTVGGQRVSAPVKGLYIKNGKKIIVK